MTFDFLTVVKMSAQILHIVTPCGRIGGTNVSYEHTVSIFRPEGGSSRFLRHVASYEQVDKPLQPPSAMSVWMKAVTIN